MSQAAEVVGAPCRKPPAWPVAGTVPPDHHTESRVSKQSAGPLWVGAGVHVLSLLPSSGPRWPDGRRVHDEPRTREQPGLTCLQPVRRRQKFSNLAGKLKSLLEMTGKPDEIVLSIGKQNCNQTDTISSWSDHANASRDTGKCV